MKKVCFSSLKGGSGKSSVAILTGNLLSKAGYRVLMIDLDIQNSLSFYYLDDFRVVDKNNLALALQMRSLPENIVDSNYSEKLKIIPSSYGLIDLRAINEKSLSRLMPDIYDYFDYCLLDCPPTLDNIVLNALYASDLIISPCRLSIFDYKGLQFLGDKIYHEINGLDRWNILINFYRAPRTDKESNLTAQYLSMFQDVFKNIFDVKIPESVLIQKAIDTREPISRAKNKEKVFNCFFEIADYITGKEFVMTGRF